MFYVHLSERKKKYFDPKSYERIRRILGPTQFFPTLIEQQGAKAANIARLYTLYFLISYTKSSGMVHNIAFPTNKIFFIH